LKGRNKNPGSLELPEKDLGLPEKDLELPEKDLELPEKDLELPEFLSLPFNSGSPEKI
jgi:hypothetical protein